MVRFGLIRSGYSRGRTDSRQRQAATVRGLFAEQRERRLTRFHDRRPPAHLIVALRHTKESPMSDARYPVAVTHVGLTVTDVYAATDWYVEVLGCRHTIGPLHIRNDGSPVSNVFKDIFGEPMQELYVSHLATANGVGIELFQFVTPPTEDSRPDNFEYWKTGVFHFCVVDPDIEGLAQRIADKGGRQNSQIWTLFEGEPYRCVYCQDPWGNLIEIYTHSTELFYANRDTSAMQVPEKLIDKR
jgi:catechol 2,3-dioxygenase-like lactoylglutathione lyase family enzyme